MSMKKMNRLTGLLLAAVLAASGFTGCGTKSGADTSSGAAGSADDGQTAAADFNKEGLPIVSEPVTLDVLTTRWGNMGDTFKQNQFLIDLETQTNVKIEWQVQSLNDWNEQKSILLASGELPSVIFGSQTFKDQDIINNLDFFMPLDDLIDAYMPNYKAAMAETPVLAKVSAFPDGKMYSLAKNLPSRPKTRNQPIINKAWLDRLGLEVPKTLDDLTNVLRAFKEQDANGNGDPADEIPFTNKDFHIDMLNPFGITDINETAMMIKDGTPEYIYTSAAYKEGLTWMRQLYEEGLIDPELFTQDDTMVTAKRQDPNVSRVGLSFDWVPDATFGKWSSEYEAIAPIAGSDGKQYAGGDPDGVFSVSRNEVEITKACKIPEIAARWIDQFYTDEASIQTFWGAIGTVIQKNEDGTYQLMDPPEDISADAWYWDMSLRDFGPKYVRPGFSEKIKLSPETGDGLKLSISKLADNYVTTPFPLVMYTAEEFEELATLTADIDAYVQTTRAKWVSNGGIDEEWDAYVAQLGAMGLDKLIEIRMNGYNRYLSQE